MSEFNLFLSKDVQDSEFNKAIWLCHPLPVPLVWVIILKYVEKNQFSLIFFCSKAMSYSHRGISYTEVVYTNRTEIAYHV